jgi:hypothetical protein
LVPLPLFPAEFALGADFKAYFFANRRWFFGIQVVVVLMDIPETLQKAVMHLRLVGQKAPLIALEMRSPVIERPLSYRGKYPIARA